MRRSSYIRYQECQKSCNTLVFWSFSRLLNHTALGTATHFWAWQKCMVLSWCFCVSSSRVKSSIGTGQLYESNAHRWHSNSNLFWWVLYSLPRASAAISAASQITALLVITKILIVNVTQFCFTPSWPSLRYQHCSTHDHHPISRELSLQHISCPQVVQNSQGHPSSPGCHTYKC